MALNYRSLFGFDYNQDGKVDMSDDILFAMHMEEEERAAREADVDFDSWDSDGDDF